MGEYGVSPDDLYALMSSKELSKLKELGGTEGIAKSLKSNLKQGLSGEDIDSRKEAFGKNEYPAPPSANWFLLFFEGLQDPALVILIVAAIVSLVAGIVEQVLGHGENHWIEGIAIIIAVLIVSGVAATNDYSKDLQFKKLKKQTNDREVLVIRNGHQSMISIFDVVVGDIAVLHTGDKLPADGLFLPGLEDLKCNESSMTGEPDDKTKNEKNPFLWSGTNVVKGSGIMLVLQVGPFSEWGRTLSHLTDEQPPTPLQEKLEAMVIFIGKIGVVVAIIVFIVLIAYYIDDYAVNPHKDLTVGENCTYHNSTTEILNSSTLECPRDVISLISGNETGNGTYSNGSVIRVPSEFDQSSLFEILYAFIIGVTIIVVAIPEGLPLAVTISLAYSVGLMAKEQNLVRHLAACETMGGATNICSDKTGTLTENRMAVVAGYIAGEKFETVQGIKIPHKGIRRVVIDSCCLNIESGQLDTTPEGHMKFVGNTTECALLVFCKKLGADYSKIQSRNDTIWKWGFTSARKRMSVIVANRKKEGDYRLYCKGAAEMVLELCVATLKQDGTVEKLSKSLKNELLQKIDDNAKLGLRNIVLAFRDFEGKHDWEKSSEGEGFEDNLTFIGIVSIEDPLRPEVPLSVKLCQSAGITVRMVTGDNLLTAKKIATDCNIFTEDSIALEGPEFGKLTDDELTELIPRLHVLARSSPTDKHTLVNKLKDLGEVVAVTGDGTNDAPALHTADVGLAMGITGTEVAKEAADIIILDDNFASIVTAVKWGRCVFDNIRKFLQFQLTINLVALITAFIGAVSRYGTPLTAVQLLWINLIMDALAALALGTERPNDELLKRKPYGRSGKLITMVMWRNIVGQAILQVTIMCIILYAVNRETGFHLIWPWVRDGSTVAGPNTQYTMLFNTFVFLQIFNEFNARKLGSEINAFDGLHKNWIFIGVILFSAGVQAIICEFGGIAINTNHLDWREWLSCIFMGFLGIPWGILLRQIPVPMEDWEVVHHEDDAELEQAKVEMEQEKLDRVNRV